MNFFGTNPIFHVGEVIHEKHGTFGPRLQKSLELFFIYEGEVTVYIDGEPRHIGPRQATLLLPGHKEYFVFSTKRKTRQGWCTSIHPNLDPAVIRAYNRFPSTLPLTRKMERLHPVACSLSLSRLPAEQELFEAAAKDIFLDFFSRAGFGGEENPLPESIQRVFDYIHQNYDKPCNLGLLSRVAGLTGAHLIRLFRKHLATTPIKFLWEVRVEAGARLLRETGLAVSEISNRTGFQNPYHFSRLVKKQLGQSPKNYRQVLLNPHISHLRASSRAKSRDPVELQVL